MSRRAFRQFSEPLAVLPFGFVGIRLVESGFNWLNAVLLVVLLFIYLPILVVLWGPEQ